jgi:hypothetical protein
VNRLGFRLLILALLAAPLVACTIKPLPSDAGTGDAGSQTVGDQCSAIATELCEQAASCGSPSPLDQCVSSETVACCTGSACSVLSLSPASAVDACKQAIGAEDCYSMTINPAPDACAGIPQKP